MPRRMMLSMFLFCAAVIMATGLMASPAQAAGRGQPTDWNRFYYYPYVYYPQSFDRSQQSYNHLYYRYPASRRIPVYNEQWYNYYPSPRPYHRGHHFILDQL
ncbi:MAG: hypothetical protein HON53_08115 [Planctomycetaceae bacterium]|jgi:hypothetical protein|nr:hypothetical protein [Planctomycetaceae bacterium]MBT6155312.1 hypothetical protein [Planctomycetaceae bacterium]MBT6485192.1 hypothetical protein [Planctomycetaceae bacterium]MBT6497123.1 hypothetical protein [Planctomycetaceae bacterium]